MSEETKSPGVQVRWRYTGRVDGDFGSYGDSWRDVLNDWGLCRYAMRWPRGKDGQGRAVEEVFYTMTGVKGSMTHVEMIAKLKEQGRYPA